LNVERGNTLIVCGGAAVVEVIENFNRNPTGFSHLWRVAIEIHLLQAEMISTSTWIGKGIAREQPEKFKMDDDEYDRICKLAQMQISAAKGEL
jgi:hypothetical protein